MELWNFISHFADVIGVLGAIVSVIIWFKIDRFAQKIEYQRMNYAKNQSNILITLKALRDNIYEDNLMTQKIVSDSRVEFYTIKQNLGFAISKNDMVVVDEALEILKKPINKIDKAILLEKFDGIIALFRKDVI